MNLVNVLTIGAKSRSVYERMCQPLCKKYDLNQTALDILLFLANNPDHNTARDIYRIRAVKSGLASVTIESLIRAGYLQRESDARDRRIQRLAPTAAAGPLIEAGRRVQRHFGEAMFRDMDEAERETFFRLGQKLLNTINELSETKDIGVTV